MNYISQLQTYGWYALGVFGIGLLMAIHEGGHFLAARAFGMRVSKFSIGFGPTVFKIVPKDGSYWITFFGDRIKFKLGEHDPEKQGPTIYQVAIIPFFAFVQIDGMNPFEETDPNDKASYANSSWIGRFIAIFGGPFANYLFASLFFFIALFFGGKLVSDPNSTIVQVSPGNPAAKANIQDGDRIVEIDGNTIETWEQMANRISSNPDTQIQIGIERNGNRIYFQVVPTNINGKGRIGISNMGKREPVGLKEATIFSLKAPPIIVKSQMMGLIDLIQGKVEGDVSGPVGIIKQTARSAKDGWSSFFEFLGILSAYLGAINLLPIPALDGGRIVFLVYEAILKRKPNVRFEATIHAFGFIVLLGLMIYITVTKDFGFKLR